MTTPPACLLVDRTWPTKASTCVLMWGYFLKKLSSVSENSITSSKVGAYTPALIPCLAFAFGLGFVFGGSSGVRFASYPVSISITLALFGGVFAFRFAWAFAFGLPFVLAVALAFALGVAVAFRIHPLCPSGNAPLGCGDPKMNKACGGWSVDRPDLSTARADMRSQPYD